MIWVSPSIVEATETHFSHSRNSVLWGALNPYTGSRKDIDSLCQVNIYLQSFGAVPSSSSAQWVPTQKQVDLWIISYEEAVFEGYKIRGICKGKYIFSSNLKKMWAIAYEEGLYFVHSLRDMIFGKNENQRRLYLRGQVKKERETRYLISVYVLNF